MMLCALITNLPTPSPSRPRSASSAGRAAQSSSLDRAKSFDDITDLGTEDSRAVKRDVPVYRLTMPMACEGAVNATTIADLSTRLRQDEKHFLVAGGSRANRVSFLAGTPTRFVPKSASRRSPLICSMPVSQD